MKLEKSFAVLYYRFSVSFFLVVNTAEHPSIAGALHVISKLGGFLVKDLDQALIILRAPAIDLVGRETEDASIEGQHPLLFEDT